MSWNLRRFYSRINNPLSLVSSFKSLLWLSVSFIYLISCFFHKLYVDPCKSYLKNFSLFFLYYLRFSWYIFLPTFYLWNIQLSQFMIYFTSSAHHYTIKSPPFDWPNFEPLYHQYDLEFSDFLHLIVYPYIPLFSFSFPFTSVLLLYTYLVDIFSCETPSLSFVDTPVNYPDLISSTKFFVIRETVRKDVLSPFYF